MARSFKLGEYHFVKDNEGRWSRTGGQPGFRAALTLVEEALAEEVLKQLPDVFLTPKAFQALNPINQAEYIQARKLSHHLTTNEIANELNLEAQEVIKLLGLLRLNDANRQKVRLGVLTLKQGLKLVRVLSRK